MAALSGSDRTKIWKGLMRYWSKLPQGDADKVVGASKYELYNPTNDTGCIADLDNWFDTHVANTTSDSVGANGAINASYRAKFTSNQKFFMGSIIFMVRAGRLAEAARALAEDLG